MYEKKLIWLNLATIIYYLKFTGTVLPLRYSKQNTDESHTANRCPRNVLLVSVLVTKKSLYLHENESFFYNPCSIYRWSDSLAYPAP